MQDPAAAAAAAFQPIKPQFPEQEQLKCPRCDSTNTKFCYYNNYNLSQPRHFCKNCRRYWTKGGALRNIPVGGGTRKNTKRSSTSQKRANPDPGPDPSPDRTNRRVPESASPTSTRTATAIAAAEKPTLMGGQNSGSGQEPVLIYGLEGDQDRKLSFSSLLSSNSQFGSIFGGLNSIGSGFKMVPMGGFVEDLHSVSHSGSGPRLGLDVQGGSENNNNNNKTAGGGGGSGGDSENYLQGSSEWGNSNGWPDLAIYTPGSSYPPIEGKPKKYFV